MNAALILVEGLPGTGKSTTAQRLHRWCERRKLAASWWLEEDPNHPATPKRLRSTASAPGFPGRCLASWARFVRGYRSAPTRLVLEGSAFQSTLRFMLEYGVPRAEILAYLRAFEAAVEPLEPRLVYLEPEEPRAFLQEFVYRIRGPQWVAKVSAYLEGTPCCRARGWSGAEGMSEFWLLYRELCEEALTSLRLPVLRIPVGPGLWAAGEARWLAWLPLEATRRQ